MEERLQEKEGKAKIFGQVIVKNVEKSIKRRRLNLNVATPDFLSRFHTFWYGMDGKLGRNSEIEILVPHPHFSQ